MITQQKFAEYIYYIEFLLVLVDDSPNHKHIRGILKLLSEQFPDYDMQTYVFSDKQETPDELYERLINLKWNH